MTDRDDISRENGTDAAPVATRALEEALIGRVSPQEAIPLALACIADLVAQVRHLQTALESRVVIEQAKGALMVGGCDGDAAFDMLKRVSQRSNRKLHEVAADLVAEVERKAHRTVTPPPGRAGSSSSSSEA